MGYILKIAGSPYYQARFVNEHGVEVQRSTKKTNRAEAEALCEFWSVAAMLHRDKTLSRTRVRAVLNEMGKLVGGDTTDVVSYAAAKDAHLAKVKATGVTETLASRKTTLNLFGDYLKDKVLFPLEDITRPSVAGFRDQLLRSGLKHSTVLLRIKVLHTFFEEAVSDGIIKHNPCSGVVVKEPKQRGKQQKDGKRKALSFAEGVKLVDTAEVEELAVIVMGLDLSARIGDAFGVRADKIDLNTGVAPTGLRKLTCGTRWIYFLRQSIS
jgi:hypothetical protein